MQVDFQNLGKKYGEVDAVSSLNLTIKSGALHFFLGPSGCGKTTTLRLLAGLEAPTSGKILFDGKDVSQLSSSERGVGMVFQNYALWPHMTVRKNIEYGLKLQKFSKEKIEKNFNEVVGFTQLEKFVDRYPAQLSGGQQQRVALARALAIRPKILLLDEPLSNLDAKLRTEMRDNITRIHAETGITTVYVTHDQKEALSMGTEISLMRKGHLIQSASPRGLYEHPSHAFVASFIGETNVVEGIITEKSAKGFQVDSALGKWSSSRHNDALALGQEVYVCFRPETLKVNFNNRSFEGLNVCQLVLDRMSYYGESEQFVFHDKNADVVKSSVFHSPEHSLKKGDLVSCAVPPADTLLLPRESFASET